MATETRPLADMTADEKLDEVVTTLRRIDGLLTEFEPFIRRVTDNPAARFASRLSRKGTS